MREYRDSRNRRCGSAPIHGRVYKSSVFSRVIHCALRYVLKGDLQMAKYEVGDTATFSILDKEDGNHPTIKDGRINKSWLSSTWDFHNCSS